MFKDFTTSQRIQIGLILGIAFLLVLGSNRLDKRHFNNVQTTINSVYEDRVLVQNLIFKLNTIFHSKKLRFVAGNDFENVASENQKAKELLVDFGATKLTFKEKNTLNELYSQFEKLANLERKILQASTDTQTDIRTIAGKTATEIEQNLNILSKIQVDESRALTQLSNKSLGVNNLLSKLETIFLILISIALLALIFYPVKTDLPVKG